MLEAGRHPLRQPRECADPLDGLPVVLLALVDEEVREERLERGVDRERRELGGLRLPPRFFLGLVLLLPLLVGDAPLLRPPGVLRGALEEEDESSREREDGERAEERSRWPKPRRPGDGTGLGPEGEPDEADHEEREEEAAREAGDGPRRVADLEREDRRPDGEEAQSDDGAQDGERRDAR